MLAFCAWVPQDIDAENGLRQQPTRPVHDPHTHIYNLYTCLFLQYVHHLTMTTFYIQ